MQKGRRAERGHFGRWASLGLELVMVVVGILMAFQLDRAHQASQDHELERRYLLRLAEDLRRDSAEIVRNIERTDVRRGQVALLQATRRDPTVAARDPHAFALALENVTWRSIATISTSTYDELQTTGRSVLLRSETLRRDLADYYAAIEEEQRLGLAQDDQDHFRIATVGLLSGSQLSSIEDPENYPFEMSPDEAISIARAFSRRADAHVWLGRLVKYQVLMKQLSRGFESRNHRLLQEVDSLIARGP